MMYRTRANEGKWAKNELCQRMKLPPKESETTP